MAIARSSTNGPFWTHSILRFAEYGCAYALAIDPADADNLYAGGYYRSGSTIPGLFKSTDGGQSWLESNSGLGSGVNTLAIDPLSTQIIYAGTWSGVYKSTDGANLWTGSGLNSCCAFAIDPNCPSTICAGTYNGVYHTTNGGQDWSPMNQGLTIMDITSLDLSATLADRIIIYAGTDGGGAFKIELPRTGLEEDDGQGIGGLPKGFTLYQNFPNPFNVTTHISYDIAKPSRVILKIYNLAGQLVSTLVDEPREMGHHTAIWDGTDDANKSVSSGVYFCRIRAGELSGTRKMVMLK